jgi:hypothetical protein
MNKVGGIGGIFGGISKMPPPLQKDSRQWFTILKGGVLEAWRHFSTFMRVPVCVCLVLFLASMLPTQVINNEKSTTYVLEAF